MFYLFLFQMYFTLGSKILVFLYSTCILRPPSILRDVCGERFWLPGVHLMLSHASLPARVGFCVLFSWVAS